MERVDLIHLREEVEEEDMKGTVAAGTTDITLCHPPHCLLLLLLLPWYLPLMQPLPLLA